jgi:alanyl-tRNA synthetase
MPMNSRETRQAFLDFFKSKGHTIVPSSSLIPENDPTLLFTTAGMVQFKQYYSRVVEPPFPCATTVQKCLRAGGKGSDLENVGKTPRHHTFFEMLGNFSFGDYFKKEAMQYAWEFITKVAGIKTDRLWVSIYENDDEAEQMWQDLCGVRKDRLVRLGKKDNFWGPAGEEGACGPCSEIYIDLRDKIEYPPCDIQLPGPNDGFLEFWNLVFNQFYQAKDGKQTPLEHTGIDTGMGFERLCMILQDKASVYETDIFVPMISRITKLAKLEYNKKTRVPVNVIADHARAVTFMLSDGVFPSNEGRGYVLRHILRRAIRYGKFIGFDTPFLYQVVDGVVEAMGSAYPEVTEKVEMVKSVIRSEEEAFFKTLNRGLEKLNELIDGAKKDGTKKMSGESLFMLYDSLGFPLDFAEQVASDEEIALDKEGFEKLMAEQKKRAKAAWKGEGFDLTVIKGKARPTEYTGDEKAEDSAAVQLIIKDGAFVESASAGDDIVVICDRTPFYGEKGGQVGDLGAIEWKGGRIDVVGTKVFEEAILHYGRVESGELRKGDSVTLKVDADRKAAVARNHTATHLIHKALRTVVGDHAAQAGSLVGPDRLRFDFTHTKALTREEILEIEDQVNRVVLKNLPVKKSKMSKDEAVKSGAVAIFEEKYGNIVRVIDVEGYSKELCGGTHVDRTGDIGLVKIVEESSVSAGTRRLEAVTGLGSLSEYTAAVTKLGEISILLNSDPAQIVERVKHQLDAAKDKEREISELKKQLARLGMDEWLRSAKKIGGATVVAKHVDLDVDSILAALDAFREKAGSGVFFLAASPAKDKVTLVAGVTKDLVGKIKAGDLARETAKILGGGGGGRPDMAQAGGKDPTKIPEALAKAEEMIAAALK